MSKNTDNRITQIKNLRDETTIIYLYRYFSLTLTSLFYLLGNSHSTLKNKLIVIVCLTIASIVLNNLYIKNKNQKKIIKILVIIEVIGITLILIPTGGLNSPYIWYALNTVLITASFLDIYFYWISLWVYLIFSILISVLVLNKENKDFIQSVFKNSNLILSFILITVLVQLLLELMKRLKDKSSNLAITNTQLSVSNKRTKESMEHIVSLYQTVHSFANHNRKDKLIAIILDYTEKITKSNFAFFGFKVNEYKWSLESSKSDTNLNSMLLEQIKSQWDIIKELNHPLNITVNNINYIVVPVKSGHMEYGVLGIEINNSQSSIFYKDNLEQIRFLSDLSSMALEKFQLEDISTHLLLSEEQNRIANELHDSVSQRLFSISCCIHDLIEKGGKITEDELMQQLQIIKDALNNTMIDLRETICGLSWKKSGESMFTLDIKNYLNEISNLTDVEISFNVIGNEELLSCDLKKAIYRIICEGTGNAIRHSECNKIEIILDIKNECILLKITDNGKGFFYNKMDISSNGLGINNIVNLVNSFNGEINIKSELDEGTCINISFIKY